MNSEILKRISNLKVIDELISIMDQVGSNVSSCSQLYGALKSILVLRLAEEENQIVILLPDLKSAEEQFVELNLLGLSDSLIFLNELTQETVQEKITKISRQKKFILISTYELLTLELPSKEHVEKTTTLIQTGGKISYDELIEYLNLLNYQKDQFVEAPGEFSVRGSVIDFWSFSESNPARLEFDGDFLESIRLFDQESQRSIEKVNEISLAGSANKKNENNSDIFDYLKNPLILASAYETQNQTFSKVETEKSGAIYEQGSEDDFPEVKDSVQIIEDSFKLEIESIINKTGTRWILEEEISTSPDRIDLGFSESPTINSKYNILFNVLKEYSQKDFEIIITSENELQTTRLTELLSEYNNELAELIESKKIKLETLPIKDGFVHNKEKILLLTDYHIFNKPFRSKLSSAKKYKKSKSKSFASIKHGDYVVHESYGIGKYAGLKTINIGDTKQESMKLLFNEGGIVYVNLNYLNLVKKYSSNENLKPTLSTLGTGEWE